MEDDAVDLEPVEEEAPEEETEEVAEEDNAESEEGEPEETAEDEEEEEPDVAEVEYEGKKYQVPPELKDALLRQSDYSRKTAEVAEQRKAIQAEREQFAQMQQASQETLALQAEAQAVAQKLQEYQKVDWQAWVDQNPQEAMKANMDMQALQGRMGQLHGEIQSKHNQALETQRETRARQIQEGLKVLPEKIPNWSPEVAQEIKTFAISQGIDERAVSSITDPSHVVLLHKAMQWDKLQQAQAKAPKKAAPVKPAAKVKAKTSKTATRDPDKMTADEWFKWRNAQLDKKRA